MQATAIIIAESAGKGTDNLPFLVAVLGVILSLLALFRISTLKPRRGRTRKPSAAADTPAAPTRIPPEIIAVIAAAASSIHQGRRIRVISIKPMSTSWERAGRQSVLTSHRIR